MIQITISRTSTGRISACTIEGHADYDEPGYDIICAAVSAISCTAIVGLQEVSKTVGQYENRIGYALIRPYVDDEGGQVILETMVLGLSEISRQYPAFVNIK